MENSIIPPECKYFSRFGSSMMAYCIGLLGAWLFFDYKYTDNSLDYHYAKMGEGSLKFMTKFTSCVPYLVEKIMGTHTSIKKNADIDKWIEHLRLNGYICAPHALLIVLATNGDYRDRLTITEIINALNSLMKHSRSIYVRGINITKYIHFGEDNKFIGQ